MIPNAKTDACEKAPPVKAFNNWDISFPPELADITLLSTLPFTPGNTTKEPNLYTSNNPSVKIILFLRSSILQILRKVVNSFCIEEGQGNELASLVPAEQKARE